MIYHLKRVKLTLKEFGMLDCNMQVTDAYEEALLQVQDVGMRLSTLRKEGFLIDDQEVEELLVQEDALREELVHLKKALAMTATLPFQGSRRFFQ